MACTPGCNMIKSIICGLLYAVSETRAPSLKNSESVVDGVVNVSRTESVVYVDLSLPAVDLSLPAAMVLVYTRHMR
jgi:hypothetical protein